MMKIKRFEDVKAWQLGREICKGIYTISRIGDFSKDYALNHQIRKAAISVPSNIAEGFARQSDKEFARFLYIAHGSLAEVQTQLYIALDLNYIDSEKFKNAYDSCDECSKAIMGFIKYLKN